MTEFTNDVGEKETDPTRFAEIVAEQADELARQFLDAANDILKADVIMDELITSWSTQDFRVKIQPQ